MGSSGEQALEFFGFGRRRSGTPGYWLNMRTPSNLISAAFHAALPVAMWFAALAGCTWASFHLGQGFAFTGFLYLVLVVLAALYGGFWLATAISLVAVTCLNYYFVPPLFSFSNSPANWVALGAFEFTAVVISRLAQRAHLQAMEAAAGRRDMERLYETSRRILLLDPSGEPGGLITSLIREIFELDSVQLFDAQSAKTYRSGEGGGEGEGQQARDAYLQDADTFEPQARSWRCAIRLGTRLIGGLALNGAEMSTLAATALASLSGIALERARSLQRESQAQAARQTEQLRTAVLDAVAHDLKTPLTVARSASSGLLAVGGLSELQEELVTMIDQQTGKLDRLVSRLLTAARLDSKEFKPQREPVLFSSLASAAIQSLGQEDRERVRVSVPNIEIPIFADRELVLTSLAQLVDNSLKYSEPGSPIEIHLTVRDKSVVFRIRSKGLVIAGADRERIFERFYRAPETHHLPAGSGIGLSIVKKIVEAHQGRVWAEGEPGYGTSFSISLPAFLSLRRVAA
jgi:two-component system sensor histidine kinase KdpD